MDKKVILALAIITLLLVTPLSVFAYSAMIHDFNYSAKAKWDSEERDLKAIQKAVAATGAKWTAGETSVSRLSTEEKKGLCGLNGFPEMKEGAKAELSPYPPTFDWRNVTGTDWTTTIKDQGPCGSCWAFGSLAAMEAQNKIEEADPGIDLDLSEQGFLSCSPGSCDGWYLSRTLNWLSDKGTVEEACLPYQADDTIPCSNVCPEWRDVTWRIKDWGWVNASINDIKGYLLEAPLPTGMTVYEDFLYYEGGVYEQVWGKKAGGHLVTIVGWDDTNECWICKNSWGEDWGEDGWFRIKYGECGIESGTAYLVDVYHVPAPTVSIYTDKTNYTPGETMLVGLQVTNPTVAQAVNAYLGLQQPDGTTLWRTKSSVTLPAGLEYSNEKVITLPDILPGTYVWRAILEDPATSVIICEGTASWDLGLVDTPTSDITEVVDDLATAIDFGEYALEQSIK